MADLTQNVLMQRLDEKGPASVREIADEHGIPDGVVYDYVQSLEREGFIERVYRLRRKPEWWPEADRVPDRRSAAGVNVWRNEDGELVIDFFGPVLAVHRSLLTRADAEAGVVLDKWGEMALRGFFAEEDRVAR